MLVRYTHTKTACDARIESNFGNDVYIYIYIYIYISAAAARHMHSKLMCECKYARVHPRLIQESYPKMDTCRQCS
jgi:hypothetical protein